MDATDVVQAMLLLPVCTRVCVGACVRAAATLLGMGNLHARPDLGDVVMGWDGMDGMGAFKGRAGWGMDSYNVQYSISDIQYSI